jgi:hypothetical protein
MSKFLCGFLMQALFVPMMIMLAGCGGGGGGEGGGGSATVAKATVSGTVSFPALSSLVAKQVASTVIPPILTITDLSGNVVATPPLSVSSDAKTFSYSTTLRPDNNYIMRATWGGQIMRGLADQSTLSPLVASVNISPVTTAVVLIVEKKLSLTSGQLGTAAASAVTTSQVGAINPAALLTAITTDTSSTYTPLVSAVTTALAATTPQDPAVAVVPATITNAAGIAYVVPTPFTTAMISGKTFISPAYPTGYITFYANGAVGYTDYPSSISGGSWQILPDGTLLATYTDLSATPAAEWTKWALQSSDSTSFTVSQSHSYGGTDVITLTQATLPTILSRMAGHWVGNGWDITIAADGTVAGVSDNSGPTAATITARSDGDIRLTSTNTPSVFWNLALKSGTELWISDLGTTYVTHKTGTFTTVMLSGKTFTTSPNNLAMAPASSFVNLPTIITLNTDGTFSGVVEGATVLAGPTQTWSIVNGALEVKCNLTNQPGVITFLPIALLGVSSAYVNAYYSNSFATYGGTYAIN